MSFQISSLRARSWWSPALPAALRRLHLRLGLNLLWILEPLHARCVPAACSIPAAWKAIESTNPRHHVLGQVEQVALERAFASDPVISPSTSALGAREILDTYLEATAPASLLIAYFSMEYGLLDCLPIYSGGLGVLSGDHLKASS